jgi:hypothetical protein
MPRGKGLTKQIEFLMKKSFNAVMIISSVRSNTCVENQELSNYSLGAKGFYIPLLKELVLHITILRILICRPGRGLTKQEWIFNVL